MSLLISSVLMIATIGSGMLLFLGLFRPWIALWWLPRQNRLLVIRWYGSICLLGLIGWLMISSIIF